MTLAGLALCSRYSYPPNSLSLCGPDKKNDLAWYAATGNTDQGAFDILSQFSTLYPYLCLIARENKIADPFDEKVVSAYWLGNKLLQTTGVTQFARHLSDILLLKKKIDRKELGTVLGKLPIGALPHHSFHVLNIYRRTGHLDIPHTLETMDACLINWGKVKKIDRHAVIVETKPLKLSGDKLVFGQTIERTLMSQGENDILLSKVSENDWVSYHWGYFCQKLTKQQLTNLIYFTNLSLRQANKP